MNPIKMTGYYFYLVNVDCMMCGIMDCTVRLIPYSVEKLLFCLLPIDSARCSERASRSTGARKIAAATAASF